MQEVRKAVSGLYSAVERENKHDNYKSFYNLLQRKDDEKTIKSLAVLLNKALEAIFSDIENEINSTMPHSCLCYLAHHPNIANSWTNEQQNHFFETLISIISSTSSKVLAGISVWSLGMQSFPKQSVLPHLPAIFNVAHKSILVDYSKGHEIVTLKSQTLKTLSNLLENTGAEGLNSLKPHWIIDVLKSALYHDPDLTMESKYDSSKFNVATASEELLQMVIKLIGENDETLSNFKQTTSKCLHANVVKDDLVSECNRCIKSSSTKQIRIIGYCIILLGKYLLHKQIVNVFLKLLEKSFSSSNESVLIASFNTWKCVIDSFALHPNFHRSNRLSLVMTPISRGYNKQSLEVRKTIVNCWQKLCLTMGKDIPEAFSTVVSPILKLFSKEENEDLQRVIFDFIARIFKSESESNDEEGNTSFNMSELDKSDSLSNIPFTLEKDNSTELYIQNSGFGTLSDEAIKYNFSNIQFSTNNISKIIKSILKFIEDLIKKNPSPHNIMNNSQILSLFNIVSCKVVSDSLMDKDSVHNIISTFEKLTEFNPRNRFSHNDWMNFLFNLLEIIIKSFESILCDDNFSITSMETQNDNNTYTKNRIIIIYILKIWVSLGNNNNVENENNNSYLSGLSVIFQNILHFKDTNVLEGADSITEKYIKNDEVNYFGLCLWNITARELLNQIENSENHHQKYDIHFDMFQEDITVQYLPRLLLNGIKAASCIHADESDFFSQQNQSFQLWDRLLTKSILTAQTKRFKRRYASKGNTSKNKHFASNGFISGFIEQINSVLAINIRNLKAYRDSIYGSEFSSSSEEDYPLDNPTAGENGITLNSIYFISRCIGSLVKCVSFESKNTNFGSGLSMFNISHASSVQDKEPSKEWQKLLSLVENWFHISYHFFRESEKDFSSLDSDSQSQSQLHSSNTQKETPMTEGEAFKSVLDSISFVMSSRIQSFGDGILTFKRLHKALFQTFLLSNKSSENDSNTFSQLSQSSSLKFAKKRSVRLWQGILDCVYKLCSPFDSKLLNQLSEELEFCFTHESRRIKNITIAFWEKSFGQVDHGSLTYPSKLKQILVQLAKNANIKAPDITPDSTASSSLGEPIEETADQEQNPSLTLDESQEIDPFSTFTLDRQNHPQYKRMQEKRMEKAEKSQNFAKRRQDSKRTLDSSVDDSNKSPIIVNQAKKSHSASSSSSSSSSSSNETLSSSNSDYELKPLGEKRKRTSPSALTRRQREKERENKRRRLNNDQIDPNYSEISHIVAPDETLSLTPETMEMLDESLSPEKPNETRSTSSKNPPSTHSPRENDSSDSTKGNRIQESPNTPPPKNEIEDLLNDMSSGTPQNKAPSTPETPSLSFSHTFTPSPAPAKTVESTKEGSDSANNCKSHSEDSPFICFNESNDTKTPKPIKEINQDPEPNSNLEARNISSDKAQPSSGKKVRFDLTEQSPSSPSPPFGATSIPSSSSSNSLKRKLDFSLSSNQDSLNKNSEGNSSEENQVNTLLSLLKQCQQLSKSSNDSFESMNDLQLLEAQEITVELMHALTQNIRKKMEFS